MCKFMETLYAVMLSHADFVPLDMLGKDIINSLSYGSFIKVIKRYLLFSLKDASAGKSENGCGINADILDLFTLCHMHSFLNCPVAQH